MKILYMIIIALVLLSVLNSKEGYAEYTTLDLGRHGGIPSYSSPEGMIDWLNVSDLEYGKLVSKLQGKNQAVTIRNLL